jgi:hypothetical protein
MAKLGRPRERDALWREKVLELAALSSKPTAAGIAAQLEEQGMYVSPRTVGRILDEAWRPLSPGEKELYAAFRWPESMEVGALPWEASAAALELLHHLRERKSPRPLTVLVRWYWRVSLAARVAAAEVGVEVRLEAAKQLCAVERLRGRHDENDKREIEWYLAFGASGDSVAYDAAISDESSSVLGPIPRWDGNAHVNIPGGAEVDEIVDAQMALMGVPPLFPEQRSMMRTVLIDREERGTLQEQLERQTEEKSQ